LDIPKNPRKSISPSSLDSTDFMCLLLKGPVFLITILSIVIATQKGPAILTACKKNKVIKVMNITYGRYFWRMLWQKRF